MALSVILAIAAYLIGSIPTAYVAVRLTKGRDIRQLGSGSISSSNAGAILGWWAAILIGCFDLMKGAVCVWIADALDRNLGQQLAVGLATVAGHNWSIFLRFHGGRGLATMVGVIMATAPLQLLMFIIVALLGYTFTGGVPFWLGLSTLLLPFWGYALEQGSAIIAGNFAMIALVFMKRLTTNMEALPRHGKARVLLNRLLLDRDTRDRESWVRRRVHPPAPPSEPGAPAQGPQKL